MRKIILFFFYFISFYSIAQVDSSNQYLKNITKPVVSADMMNVLYQGVKNPLSIAVPNIPCESLIVTASNNTVFGNNCDYWITPKSKGQTKIIVSSINKNDTLIHGEYLFRVKSIPKPTPSICGTNNIDNIITLGKLNSCQGLILRYENFDFDLRVVAKSFELVIYQKDCKITKLKSFGPRFTQEMKTKFKTLESGDSFVFKNILALAPDGNIIEVVDLRIKIK